MCLCMYIGHDLSVDYWALGCLIFEMCVGRTPFAAASGEEDITEIFSNIALSAKKPISFPAIFDSSENYTMAKDLVSRLLQVEPTKRLGNQALGPGAIRLHPFFMPINFQDLVNGSIRAPWIPDPFDIESIEKEEGYEEEEEDENSPTNDKDESMFMDF